MSNDNNNDQVMDTSHISVEWRPGVGDIYTYPDGTTSVGPQYLVLPDDTGKIKSTVEALVGDVDEIEDFFAGVRHAARREAKHGVLKKDLKKQSKQQQKQDNKKK